MNADDNFWNAIDEHVTELKKAGITDEANYKPRSMPSKQKAKPSKKRTYEIDELISKVESKLKDKKIKNLIKKVESTVKNKKDIKDIKNLISMSPDKIKKTKLSNITRAVNLVSDMIHQPKMKKYKNDIESVDDIIKEVESLLKAKPKALKKLVKADKEHLKYHPSEQDKKELKIDKAFENIVSGFDSSHVKRQEEKVSKMSKKELEAYNKRNEKEANESILHDKLEEYFDEKFPDSDFEFIVPQLIRTNKLKTKQEIKQYVKDHTEPEEPVKKPEASILLSPYKYENKPLIEQVADSMKQHPEFDTINKKKIKAYSYDVVKKFDKKYHDLMLRLFKTETAITKLLQKKADNVEKKVISEEKKTNRVKKYQEEAKEKRKEVKKKKYKDYDKLTEAEQKKFKQAKNYYIRKSKESNILPKNLNKTDLESLNMVCSMLAEDGFDTMSESLFMKYYEG